MLYCITDIVLYEVTHLCDEAGDVSCTGGQCNVSWFTV